MRGPLVCRARLGGGLRSGRAAKFKPSRQLIAAHTTTGKASTRLNLTARKITH